MTSGGWAASSRLSSLVIYHICFSGETGPSLTLSRTGNAIKPVLQETLSPVPFIEGGRGQKGSPGGEVGKGTSSNASLSPSSQEVSSSITRTTETNVTNPATAKPVALTGLLTASQHPLMVSSLLPPWVLLPPVRLTPSLVTSHSCCHSQHH